MEMNHLLGQASHLQIGKVPFGLSQGNGCENVHNN